MVRKLIVLSIGLSIGLLLTTATWAKYDPIMQAPDIVPGWSPAQASDWMGAKLQYAEAVNRYGENSQQALKAHTRMLALSRVLHPDEAQPFNRVLNAGNNGTLAPTDVFDKWVPPAQNDTPEGQFTPSDPLTIPPQ